MLSIGEWRIDPVSCEIARNGQTARLDARTMRLLLCLAEHSPETVSIDDLLAQVWPDVTVSSDSVYQAVATLRRALGDDPKNPAYIATIPRLGYRMLAEVRPGTDGPGEPSCGPAADARSRPRFPSLLLMTGVAAAVLVLAAGFLVYQRIQKPRQQPSLTTPAVQAQQSVAVLPFLDLTAGMRNEEFADGMTEELIDRLSKIRDLHVPSATASFYFKNKQVALGEIAKNLGVAYVLDGSVRKSGTRLRIAARLVRAENAYVIWSETYDRPAGDLLNIQDDIAGEVARALAQTIKAQP